MQPKIPPKTENSTLGTSLVIVRLGQRRNSEGCFSLWGFPGAMPAVPSSGDNPCPWPRCLFFHPLTPFSACDFVMEASCVHAWCPLFLACPPYHSRSCPDTTTLLRLYRGRVCGFSWEPFYLPHLAKFPLETFLHKLRYTHRVVRDRARRTLSFCPYRLRPAGFNRSSFCETPQISCFYWGLRARLERFYYMYYM